MALGKYLYCIIRCAQDCTFEGVAAIGEPNNPVYTVPYDGLAVVVSDSLTREYSYTRANLLAHQRVGEQVMAEFPLLPMRFGTLTPDAASAIPDICKLLAKRSQEFHDLLSEMEGKVELGLKALWRDEKLPFQEILAQNPPIQRLRDSLRRQPLAVARREGIRLGEMVQEALKRKREGEAECLLAPLRRLAYRWQENDVLVDKMIANAAFLVEGGRAQEFDGAVSRLEEEHGQRIALKYVGPVPPYNFVDVVVNWEEL